MTASQSQRPGMQPNGGETTTSVFRVPASRQMEALEQLVSAASDTGREAARRFREYAKLNKIDLTAMWAAQNTRGRIERSLLAVPAPGRTAMVFVTRPTRAADVEPTGELIDRSARDMDAFDINLAQVLIDPRDRKELRAFELGGFTQLANLSYLERSIPTQRLAPPPTWPDGVTVEACRDPFDADWARALEQSYIDTLDCPGLLGLRRIEDVLEGHKAVGAFEPELWTLLRIEGEPAGVLLLNPTPTTRSLELVYLGLIPEARGRGLAKLLLEYGLSLVAGRNERVISLAVDEQNTPAIRLYTDCGFHAMLRRIACIRSIAGAH